MICAISEASAQTLPSLWPCPTISWPNDQMLLNELPARDNPALLCSSSRAAEAMRPCLNEAVGKNIRERAAWMIVSGEMIKLASLYTQSSWDRQRKRLARSLAIASMKLWASLGAKPEALINRCRLCAILLLGVQPRATTMISRRGGVQEHIQWQSRAALQLYLGGR